MGKEIERKFLVNDTSYRKYGNSEKIIQGFLSVDKDRVVRLRASGGKGVLTIKGSGNGIERIEFEYSIPLIDAIELINNLCLKPIIEKYRYKIFHDGLIWEVDEFLNENEGLIIAEVELDHPDQEITLPDWVGKEVTNDDRYYNINLVKEPFRHWQ
jgi:CYTH domain-containing protein